MNDSKILTVNKLTKKFSGKTVVDGISFQVNRGEIMGLVGPNGAGKTTAIRMIMGILRPDAGEISFHFTKGKRAMDKRRIGYLPEERGLYDDAKVLDILVYLAGLKGKPRSAARKEGMEWLQKVGLEEYAQSKLDKLSKGMQQKVQFIASILHRPELVLLDEPFSGLDPINQDYMKDTIRELQESGMTILLSAHQMSVMEELCHTIFMINRGRQVLSGNLKDIKNSHGHLMVEIRFSNDIVQHQALQQLPGITIEKQFDKGLKLRYDGSDDINSLINKISAAVSIEEISVIKPPLHDIFIKVAQEQGEEVNENEVV